MGGDDTQKTSNSNANYDNRQVYTYDTQNYDLSNRSTTNTTNNSTTNADFSNRSVNTSNTTTNADFSDRSSYWADSSNRSVTTSTTNADFSDRSTSSTWADNSNRSTNTTYNTTTDGGAVAGALSLASGAVKTVTDQLGAVLGFASQVAAGQTASTTHAYDYADQIFSHAIDTVNQNAARELDAFDRAAHIQEGALASVQNAYADAKGTTQAQQKIMMGVLAVAAVAVLAPRLGK